MIKKIVAFALLVALLASIYPVFAWIGPPYENHRGTEDYKYDLFGPKLDYLLIKMYGGTDPMWEALRRGEIDITDWSLTPTYLNDFLSCDEPHIAVGDAGGELGMYVFDMNNDVWRNDDGDDVVGDEGDVRNPLGDPTIITADPSWNPYFDVPTPVTRGSQFRLALAHMIDRSAIIARLGVPPTYYPMYTHMPITDIFEIPGWINHDVMMYPYDLDLAKQILDGAGFVDTDGDGYRNYDSDGDGDIDSADANINLRFYTRKDAFRATLGDWVCEQFEDERINILYERIPCTGLEAHTYVMTQKRHNLYTAGWILGREPTTNYFLYNSAFYWHPGDPPNYNKVSDPEYDKYSELVAYPPDMDTAKEACLICQEVMNRPYAVYNIPIANSWMQKAFKIYAEEGTSGTTYWQGFLNCPGYGINTAPGMPLETTYNAYAPGFNTIKYGWKELEMPSSLNPFQYSWYWDAEVLFRIYEALLVVNPMNPFGGGPGTAPSGDIPWIAVDWEIGTYTHPDTGEKCSKFTFHLRKDVYFQDGTPLTAKDIYYTVQFGWWQAEDHDFDGDGVIDWEALPPWFWGNIMDLTPEYSWEGPGNPVVVNDVMGVGVDMPDGPDGFTIVFNYNIKSVWAFWWCGVGIPIVPKHKWWDVFTPDCTGSDGFAPDPQMIGTGPWMVYPGTVDPPDNIHYKPSDFIRLDKNPNFHHKYTPPAPDLQITFKERSPWNTPDIFIENYGTTFRRLKVKVAVVGTFNAKAWTISDIPVTPKIGAIPGWGTTTPPQLTPGYYTMFVFLYEGNNYLGIWGVSNFQVLPGDLGIPGDLCGSTAPKMRLPLDNRVDYKDAGFFNARLSGQVLTPGW